MDTDDLATAVMTFDGDWDAALQSLNHPTHSKQEDLQQWDGAAWLAQGTHEHELLIWLHRPLPRATRIGVIIGHAMFYGCIPLAILTGYLLIRSAT